MNFHHLGATISKHSLARTPLNQLRSLFNKYTLKSIQHTLEQSIANLLFPKTFRGVSTLDYALTTANIMEQLVSFEIPLLQTSDHLPLSMELQLKTEKRDHLKTIVTSKGDTTTQLIFESNLAQSPRKN